MGACGTEHQATARASVHPTVRDLAWAAGFLEGEGYFTRGNGSSHVRANQVQREPLERVFRLFGGRLHSVKGPSVSRPNSQDKWEWYASGARARGIMMTLYALMSPKRQAQIRAALEA